MKDFKKYGGKKEIVYSKSKDKETSIYYSRWYGKGGAQQMPCEIRKFLQGEQLCDIDIVNSAPSIILGITNKYNIENKYLTRYVNDRQKIINKYYGGVKKNVKDFIKFCLFSDKAFSKDKIKFELNMIDEMKNIRIQLAEHENFKPIYEYNKKELKKKNPYGSFLSDVYSIYEANIIWKAMKKFEIDGNTITDVQQFDGFQGKNNKLSNHMGILTEYISKEMGFKIEFDHKSNESEIKMDEKKIKVIDTDKEDDKTDEETDEETEEKKNYFITVDDLENNLQLSKIIKNELFENLKYCNETWHLKQHPLWITVKEPSSIAA